MEANKFNYKTCANNMESDAAVCIRSSHPLTASQPYFSPLEKHFFVPLRPLIDHSLGNCRPDE